MPCPAVASGKMIETSRVMHSTVTPFRWLRATATAKHAPWRIKSYATFETLALARDFERYLKSGSGHAFAHRHLGW